MELTFYECPCPGIIPYWCLFLVWFGFLFFFYDVCVHLPAKLCLFFSVCSHGQVSLVGMLPKWELEVECLLNMSLQQLPCPGIKLKWTL